MNHEFHKIQAVPSENATPLLIEELTSISHPDIIKAGSFMVKFLTSYENIDEESLQKAWSKYTQITETIVDSIEESDMRSKAQIAAMMNKASIFHQTGNIKQYLEELDSAEVYATTAGLTNISDTLKTEIQDQLEQLYGTKPETLVPFNVME